MCFCAIIFIVYYINKNVIIFYCFIYEKNAPRIKIRGVNLCFKDFLDFDNLISKTT